MFSDPSRAGKEDSIEWLHSMIQQSGPFSRYLLSAVTAEESLAEKTEGEEEGSIPLTLEGLQEILSHQSNKKENNPQRNFKTPSSAVIFLPVGLNSQTTVFL